MNTTTVAGILVILVAIGLFGMPIWLIWTVKELFNVDWSDKYWAVFSLIMIVGLVVNSNQSKK